MNRHLVSGAAAALAVVLAIGSADDTGPRSGSAGSTGGPDGDIVDDLDNAGSAMGAWVVGSDIDPMTDQPTVTAQLKWKVEGWLQQPQITVRCHGNKTQVLYDFKEGITRTNLTGGLQHKAKFRWDEQRALGRTFTEAEGLTTTVFADNSLTDAKRLIAHKRLRVQYTKALGGDVMNHDVDLTGAEQALKPVRGACGW